jgi:hypothetical protein
MYNKKILLTEEIKTDEYTYTQVVNSSDAFMFPVPQHDSAFIDSLITENPAPPAGFVYNKDTSKLMFWDEQSLLEVQMIAT